MMNKTTSTTVPDYTSIYGQISIFPREEEKSNPRKMKNR
jgi:hypothetical protein